MRRRQSRRISHSIDDLGLQKQQNFLAKLYTDAEFRRAFLSAPEEIGARNGLAVEEIREIAEIMPEELNFFADSLFWKRLREVEKFLPLTKKVLKNDFTRLFREFSGSFNPQSVKKHFEDALEFAGFLVKREISLLARNAAKFERAKLEFFGLEKKIVVCRLDYDLRNLEPHEEFSFDALPRKQKKTAVWLRIGKRIRHFFI